MKNYVRTPEQNMFRYGSGKTILTERLLDGRLLFCDMRANGVPVLQVHEEHTTASFNFQIDGCDMDFGWESEGFDVSTSENGGICGTLSLKSTRFPVKLNVKTVAGEEGFFNRTLTLTNLSDKSMRIGNITPFNAQIFRSTRGNILDGMLHSRRDNAYSIGHFCSDEWGSEGDFRWDSVPKNTGMTYGTRRGRSGHGHPFMIARDELFGGYFLCQLGWSANWTATAYVRENIGLMVSIAPQSPNPARILMPNETMQFPSVVFGMNATSFDELISGLHAFQRKHIFKVKAPLQPVIINHWGYMCHEMSEEKLMEQIDIGAKVGGELFMIDAGWYGRKGVGWAQSTGDWVAGERMPNDLYPVFEYARSKGMKTGLWMEFETAGSESLLALEHPDWFLERYGKTVERVLDLTKPEVFEFVQNSAMDVIERYKLDMLRLDYNSNAFEGGFNTVEGVEENTLYRHVEAMWKIFDNIRAKYPNIQLENCSSGGGRTDIGMVSRFTTTWVSDWMLLPRTVRILNGMTMVLPPHMVNRQFGVSMEGAYTGSLEAALTASVMGHPSISGFAPSSDDINPEALETIAKYMDVYKNHIRPMHEKMTVFHHTPVLPGTEGEGWCVLEYGTEDLTCSVVGIWRQYAAEESSMKLCLRSIDPGERYLVRVLPTEATFEMSGTDLLYNGLNIRLDTSLTSQLLILKKL